MLIMTFSTKVFSSVPAGVIRAAAAGFGAVATLAKALVHRREVLRLGDLDERSLKDIGLLRSDVDGALATSWLKDPSAILAARAGERSCVASLRRGDGVRRAQVKALAERPRVAPAARQNTVACSA
jgi:uncharacterized protein YjiS (DUF1127 family)